MENHGGSGVGNAEVDAIGSTTPRRFTRTCGVHLLDLLEPIGNKPPAEAEEAFHANLNTRDMVA